MKNYLWLSLLGSALLLQNVCADNQPATSPPIQASVMVVNLTHPEVLHADHPDLRLTPGSTSKLFTTALALRQLGPIYQFTTPIYYRGTLRNGVLHGDLIFYGIGDPTITNENLWNLANQLQQMGLKKIRGNVIVNTSYLGDIAPDDPDRAKALTVSDSAYDSLLSSAGTDFGVIGVSVFPSLGSDTKPRVALAPFALPNITVVNQVALQDKTTEPLLLTRNTQNDKEIITASGKIGKNEGNATQYLSVGNPNLLTGNLLAGFLAAANIELKGQVVIDKNPLSENLPVLLSNKSERLVEMLQVMLYNSNNYIADMLVLDAWRQQQTTANGHSDLAIASQLLMNEFEALSANSAFREANVGLPTLHCGSGLCASNKVSARDLIVLLDGMYHDKANFPMFQGAMPSFAKGLKFLYKFTPEQEVWAKQLSVKPGSMDITPVLSVAGYFRLPNGDMAAYAILLNQPLTPTSKRLKAGPLPGELMRQMQAVITRV